VFGSIAAYIYYSMGMVVTSKIYQKYVMIYHLYLYLITLLKRTAITLVSNSGIKAIVIVMHFMLSRVQNSGAAMAKKQAKFLNGR
jgi:hypothetical protein